MWAGIGFGSTLVTVLIYRQVIGPLEKYKQENLAGTVKPDDSERKEVKERNASEGIAGDDETEV
jgi:hypothetical protein